jgi:hypothetical protein
LGNRSFASAWQTAILTFVPIMNQHHDFNQAFRQQAKDGKEQKIIDEHLASRLSKQHKNPTA